jgi:hypothetical protein
MEKKDDGKRHIKNLLSTRWQEEWKKMKIGYINKQAIRY